jgi:hypothetical protein
MVPDPCKNPEDRRLLLSFVNSFYGNANAFIRIYGEPIPEPATISLLLVGGVGLVK